MATRTRQLTLHFDEMSQHILDFIKREARNNYRSYEQQAVFMLSSIVPKPEYNGVATIRDEEKGEL